MKHLLSPKQLGQALGVSESSLKRWIDDGRLVASRTLGGHRRIPISEAVRFIRETGLSIAQPQVLGLDDLAQTTLAASGGEHNAAFLEALRSGNGPAARGILLNLYLSGWTAADLFDGPVAFAMTELGTLWQHDDKGIYLEHQATDLCLAAVQQLRSVLPPPSMDAPVAVGAAPTDDPYLLATLAAAVTLQSIGWRAINLGPQTPLSSLRDAALDSQARIVWVSVSTEAGLRRLLEGLADLSAALISNAVHLVVGGRALGGPLAPHGPSVHRANSMAELAAFCSGLTASSRKAPTQAVPES